VQLDASAEVPDGVCRSVVGSKPIDQSGRARGGEGFGGDAGQHACEMAEIRCGPIDSSECFVHAPLPPHPDDPLQGDGDEQGQRIDDIEAEEVESGEAENRRCKRRNRSQKGEPRGWAKGPGDQAVCIDRTSGLPPGKIEILTQIQAVAQFRDRSLPFDDLLGPGGVQEPAREFALSMTGLGQAEELKERTVAQQIQIDGIEVAAAEVSASLRAPAPELSRDPGQARLVEGGHPGRAVRTILDPSVPEDQPCEEGARKGDPSCSEPMRVEAGPGDRNRQ
jgi:hypothetical protein